MYAEKRCSRCGLTKPASLFTKEKSRKGGLGKYCKSCRQANYQANREVICERVKKYQSNNRDKIAERKRQYYSDNRNAISEQRIRYRADHKDEIAEVNRRSRAGGRPADKPWPEEPIAYDTAHSRVKAIYGPASNYSCIECGAPAKDWAYQGGCPREMTHVVSESASMGTWARMAGRQVKYSPDPSMYSPMCKACHTKRDKSGLAA